MLAAFLGLAKGASERYVENVDLQRKREGTQAKLLATNTASYNQIVRDDAAYVRTPEIQYLSGQRQANGEDIAVLSAALQKREHMDGTPSSFVNKNDPALVRASELFKYDEWKLNPNDYEPEVRDTLLRYDAVVTSTLAELYEEGTVTDTVNGKVVSVQPIIGKIPGFEEMPVAKQNYIIEKAAQSIGKSTRVQSLLGLAPDVTVEVQGTDAIIRPRTVTTPNGETKSLDDPEVQAQAEPLVKVAAQSAFLRKPKDHFEFVLQGVNTISNKTTLTQEQAISAVVAVNGHYNSGNISTAVTGKLSAGPAQIATIRQDIDPILNQIGFGNTVSLMQYATPAQALYAGEATKTLDLTVSRRNRILDFKANVLGIKTSDDVTVQTNKLTTLQALQTNIADLQYAITTLKGQQPGTVGAGLTKIKAGLLNTMSQLSSSYKDRADVAANISGLEKFLAGLESVEDIQKQVNYDKIVSFLTNQLAYNIARSLESSTGNARLSNIDVENAKESLGLTGIFATPGAALAVLDLLSARTTREIEYQTAITSDILPRMQNAFLLQQIYGAESMLRVKGFNDTSLAGQRQTLQNFRNSVVTELQQQPEFADAQFGVIQPTEFE